MNSFAHPTAHVAIHAHQLCFVDSPAGVNVFPSWLADYRNSLAAFHT